MLPTLSSPSSLRPSIALAARSNETPPPGTMPSSTAARVAFSASSTRAFFSFIAVSHCGLGGRPDLDHRHAAGQLCQPLLQLLAVVIRRGLLDLGADLLDAALDLLRLAGALDDRGVVLVEDQLLGLSEVLELDVLELDPEVLRDRLAAGERGDVLEHGLA